MFILTLEEPLSYLMIISDSKNNIYKIYLNINKQKRKYNRICQWIYSKQFHEKQIRNC